MKNEDFGIHLPIGPGTKFFDIGAESVKIGEFQFNKNYVTNNSAFFFTLLIASDPTPKQKEILNKFEVRILDDFGKQFYPPKEEEGE